MILATRNCSSVVMIAPNESAGNPVFNNGFSGLIRLWGICFIEKCDAMRVKNSPLFEIVRLLVRLNHITMQLRQWSLPS